MLWEVCPGKRMNEGKGTIGVDRGMSSHTYINTQT